MKTTDAELFATERVSRILLRTAPPVMLAQLIQSLYNIVDSYFVGQYSADGLTALSVIFPVQLIIDALAVGLGVGVNTQMARLYAQNRPEDADRTAGTGTVMSVLCWALFSVGVLVFLHPYAAASAQSQQAVAYSMQYGLICCVGSLGSFLNSMWSKVHQATGNMRLPMLAQIAGAVTNIIFDPLLIFGLGPFPEWGVAGAAIATVAGQVVSACITGHGGLRKPPPVAAQGRFARTILKLGYPYILMQATCTVYIAVLNIILAGFADAAVTVLGLYYKYQTFFFIPLLSLNTCIVPVLSFNYARGSYRRCRAVVRDSILLSLALMLVGVVCFEVFPAALLGIFSKEPEVLAIGVPAFRLIGLCFCPAVFSLMMPVFFQAIGASRTSSFLALLRQFICLIPIFWLLSKLGLGYVWAAFPLSEALAGAVGYWLYRRQLAEWPAE